MKDILISFFSSQNKFTLFIKKKKTNLHELNKILNNFIVFFFPLSPFFLFVCIICREHPISFAYSVAKRFNLFVADFRTLNFFIV